MIHHCSALTFDGQALWQWWSPESNER